MIRILLLLTVICAAAGFNIFTKPLKHFNKNDDALFGQTTVQSKDGVLVTSPNSRPPVLLSCTLKDMCSEVNISVEAVKGLRPIVSTSSSLTKETQKHMVCQQVRKEKSMTEDLNGNCAVISAHQLETISPAGLVVTQLERNVSISQHSQNNNNNNNNNSDKFMEFPAESIHQPQHGINNKNNNNNNYDDNDVEDPGTEIAFLLDGSGSINETDFERAKQFISTVMRKVWEKCLNCDFAVLQFGTKLNAELLIEESISNSTKALETVKNIKQINGATKTASAIIYLCDHIFVAENGSKKDSKKIMIVLSDGQISLFDKVKNSEKALNRLEIRNITSFAIGVGDEIKNSATAIEEMKNITSNKDNLFLVDDYKALDSILSQLETKIIKGIEGITQGDGFQFQLAEAGFSNHMAPDGSILFGAVGANDWSGGVIVRRPGEKSVTFLNGSLSGPRFAYLGYSVVSAVGSFGTLYISGAPRYHLTGGVFVFNAASHKQLATLQGDQVGSYFGSVLCALDSDMDGQTDYLLIGAPHFHQKGEEGKVYVYSLTQGMFLKRDGEWQGVDTYQFARFGSAIAAVGDLDGNKYSDVAVGAPLEEDDTSGRSGSIYIYNGVQEGIRSHFSQRIPAGDFPAEMKLRHFGQSVSAFSYQADTQRQAYISVGSQGYVTVLETLPVIAFKPRMNLTPNNISLSEQTNTKATQVTLTICFNSEKEKLRTGEKLAISYNIHLDVGQNKQKRLFFKNETVREGNFTLLSEIECLNPVQLLFKGCYDCFSPIKVKLSFTLPPNNAARPLRILDAFTPTEVTEKIEFQKDCLNKCNEDISLSDSRFDRDRVVIGFEQNVSISFNLTNRGDGAYMTTLVLTYPNILLYISTTHSQKMKGSVVCEVKAKSSQLRCHLLHPIFRRNAQMNFSIYWQLVNKKSEMQNASIIANLTCENTDTHVLDSKEYMFGIKNALKVQLTGEATPNVLKFIDRTEKAPLTFTFQLHGDNSLNATIRMNISIKLHAHHTDLKMISTTPKDKCVVPASAEVQPSGEYLIQCVVTDLQEFVIMAEATVRDIQGASENITAEATLGFDRDRYEALEVKPMELVVTVRKLAVKSMAAIIGGSIGGFLFLALIIFLLIKCGFFKRRHEVGQRPSQRSSAS